MYHNWSFSARICKKMFSIHIKTNKSQHRLFDVYDEAPSVSCPYIIFMWTLLVARFHTWANLFWQLFWQKYAVLGSNLQVSAKTRHFYYQQPFPFPVRLKELFKLISVSDDCFVNKRREGKDICTSLTSMHYFDILALLLHICTYLTKHRKNCECCPGHYLIENHYSSTNVMVQV